MLGSGTYESNGKSDTERGSQGYVLNVHIHPHTSLIDCR